MEITEVIRGEEWLPSLPLHYLLYEAFGWQDTMPRFAHLSLLLKPVGNGKLSKRDGDKLGFPVFPLAWKNPETGEVSHGYREDGYFPEAFVNLLAMLGWNPGDDREMFTLEELVQAFSLDKVQKAGAKFNPDKAKWYNKEYLREKTTAQLTDLFLPVLECHDIKVVDCPCNALTAGVSFEGFGADFSNHVFTREYAEAVVELVKERATFVADMWESAKALFMAPTEFLQKDVDKFWTPENLTMARDVCRFVTEEYKGSMDAPVLEEALVNYIKGHEYPMGKVMNSLRLSLTGAASGLGIAAILSFIGRAEFARRMQR